MSGARSEVTCSRLLVIVLYQYTVVTSLLILASLSSSRTLRVRKQMS